MQKHRMRFNVNVPCRERPRMNRRCHPPEIKRIGNEGGTARRSSWPCRIFFGGGAVSTPSFLSRRSPSSSSSTCQPHYAHCVPLVSVISRRKCGSAVQTGGDVTQFTPCTHDGMGGVCTGGEEGYCRRDDDGTAAGRSVTQRDSFTHRAAAQCTRQWRNRLALRYVMLWERRRLVLR